MRSDLGVTGLRGWASIMVLAFHVGSALHLPMGNWVFGWGYAGVDLFFVVSGYLLTKKVWSGDYRGPDGSFSPTIYYLRRAFRIWPLYWLTLPLFIGVLAYPSNPLDLLFAQNYWPSTFSMLPPWTLCIEELFYAIVPFWAIAYRSRWWPHLTIGLFVASVAWRTYALTPSADTYLLAQFPAYAFSYGVGAIAARGVVLRLPRWAVGSIVVAALPSLVVLQYRPVEPVLAALVAFVILTAARDDAALRHPISQFVGRLTYPVYLFGFPIQAGLTATGMPPWAWAAGTFGATIALAWYVSWAFERPVIEWGHRIECWATGTVRAPRAARGGAHKGSLERA